MKRDAILEEIQTPELELRVFYGPQAGSRLPLAAGHYLLGSSDECTIILNGPRIELVHALIDFDDTLPSITPMDGNVSDAQGNPIEDRLPMSFGMPLEIGGVWIAIDYVESPWPDPASVAPISSASPVVVPEIQIENKSGDATADSIQPLLQSGKKNKSRIIIAAASSFFLLLLLVGVVLFSWSFQNNFEDEELTVSTQNLPNEPSFLKQLREQLDALTGKDHLKITFANNKQVKVAGYVDDFKMKARLDNILLGYSPTPTSEIFVEDELLENAKKLISDSITPGRAKLKVESFSDGNLKVIGAVASSSIKEEIFELIKNGVPGITNIDGSITLAEDLPQKLEEEISNMGLSRRFQIVSKQPEFFMRGKLTEKELNTWENLLVKFNDTYGTLLQIRANISMLQTTLPVNVETIVGGSTPFVITKNGQRIERGGDINGNVLTIVKDNEIIFDGNERFRIGR